MLLVLDFSPAMRYIYSMEKVYLMTEKVWKYMEENHMLQPGDHVVAGVSGGADSVCLLFLLQEYRKRVPITLQVVHVNHGIREDAGQDAGYVEELCRRLEIPCRTVEVPVHEIAQREHISTEEAGRKARYRAFEEAAGELSGEEGRRVKVALAHHMGDRAETLLFHLFRGSGSRGLGSIRPILCRGEQIEVIRPLLCLEREEIEEYLRERGIDYCRDSTNQEDTYTRNRIRHHILPYAREEICRGAVGNINRAAEQLEEIEDYLEQETDRARACCVTREGIRVQAFAALPRLLQKRVVLRCLKEISGGGKDIAAVHVESVLSLFQGKSGRRVDLPYGITARREYDIVMLEKMDPTGKGSTFTVEIPVSMEELEEKGFLSIPVGGAGFELRLLPYKKDEGFPLNQYTKWFDYDTIKDTIWIRTRRPGDFLRLADGSGGSFCKTVKDYMINEKIPRRERDTLPLLVRDHQVLWIPGYRISSTFQVGETTGRVLQVTFRPAKGWGFGAAAELEE